MDLGKIFWNKFFIGGFLLVLITILVPYVVKYTLREDADTYSAAKASSIGIITIRESPTSWIR